MTPKQRQVLDFLAEYSALERKTVDEIGYIALKLRVSSIDAIRLIEEARFAHQHQADPSQQASSHDWN